MIKVDQLNFPGSNNELEQKEVVPAVTQNRIYEVVAGLNNIFNHIETTSQTAVEAPITQNVTYETPKRAISLEPQVQLASPDSLPAENYHAETVVSTDANLLEEALANVAAAFEGSEQ